MKVPDLEIRKYLGNTDVKLSGLNKRGLERLVNWRNENCNYFTSITDYLFLRHQTDNKSIKEISVY